MQKARKIKSRLGRCSMATPLCLVGIGKIATDAHVPALASSSDWELAATVSRSGAVDGIPAFEDFETFLRERPDVPVISLCLPPAPRFDYAIKALAAGRHVMLEKPPGVSIQEVQKLSQKATVAGVTLFATWHSRMAAGVIHARKFLQNAKIEAVDIVWKEDIRVFHPDQEWVFEKGSIGVFDSGINALSILTHILPEHPTVLDATLDIPANRAAAIGAHLALSGDISAHFDWRHDGPQIWSITAQTDKGTLRLSEGGAHLEVDGVRQEVGENQEYPELYARMAHLVESGKSDVDASPLKLTFDALERGKRREVAAFHF